MAHVKRYFVHTFGCQMNVSDTQRMGEILGRLSYVPTPTADNADLIILNTCSIREKAEDKMLSALGRYRQVKTTRGALVAVAGCVAQAEKEKLTQRVPWIDFVFGPDVIPKLPQLLERVAAEGRGVVDTAWVDSADYVFPRADVTAASGRVTEFITVMKGCDNVCSFCIVPHTRGREVSRPWQDVLDEARGLAAHGVRELTLIGQNVNSYRGGIDFAELLLRTADLPGVARVRFTTSHPHDLSDALIAAFKAEPRIAPHFHLPVQSGSDAVLKRMRRDYTVAAYLERLDALRAARPDIAVTTDIIVGFPGETEEDFEGTLALTGRVRYDGQYSFVFSPRPKTGAYLKEAEWGAIPEPTKLQRLERLQRLQKQITLELSGALVGQRVEVLVEGASKNDPSRRYGKTPQNKTVNFDGDAPAGAIVEVEVRSATASALYGAQAS